MTDRFTEKALSQGYKARSVFKIKDMDKKFHIIKKGYLVLDIGASPGSWSQYVFEKGALVDAVDLDDVNVEGVNFIRANIEKKDIFEKIQEEYDVVLSDVAPKTTGVLDIDNYNSFLLSSRALEISQKVLKKTGVFVCKIFQSKYYNEFLKNFKKSFKKVRTVKPLASKKRSKEMYLIGFEKV